MLLTPDPNCRLCKLHESAKTVCLLGTGSTRRGIMIIGEAPGEREDELGRPFVGTSGRLLDKALDAVGIDRAECFVTNAVACRPPHNRAPTPRELRACHTWLKHQIDAVRPRYVLLLGNTPLRAVLGVAGIKKRRGRPVEHDGMIVLPTYHPAYILRDDKHWPTFERDLRTFRQIIEFQGIPEERAIRPTIVDTWRKVDKMLEALAGVVSCDIETTGLYPWDEGAAIVTLGFGTDRGEWHIPVNHPESPWSPADIAVIIERLTEALADVILVFQNGKFDVLWLWVHVGARWRIGFDTMLAHYMLNENVPHDLESMAQLYCAAPQWDIALSEKQGNAPFAKIAKYHAHDLYYTRKLYFILRRELKKDAALMRVYNLILLPCANVFTEIEYNGMFIDLSKMAEAEKYLQGERDAAARRLEEWGDINWASPKQVGELLYGTLKIKCALKTNKGANSTSESALNQIDHPAVADLMKFRGAKQQLSFFIDGWKPFLNGPWLHPSFKLHGTVTGRLSSEHPNCQQIPRDKRIRTLITAPKGWTLVECDLSQIEMRIAAEMSRDPSLRHAFTSGIDVHWQTALREIARGAGLRDLVLRTASTAKRRPVTSYAEAIDILLDIGPSAAADIDEAWKEHRKKAKAVGFGYLFGMWWKKFKTYARDNYGVHLTDAECRESRSAFFDLYSSLEGWHKKQRSFAASAGYVRSLSGRKRRLPAATGAHDTPERAEAQRQAINSPVQSFANDLNLMVLLQIVEEFPSTQVQVCATVHDAILARVRNDTVRAYATRVQEIMKSPRLLQEFEIKLTVPIEGETKIGPWGAGVAPEKWK